MQPELHVDASKDRFPCCIVWTPIPLITWILPFVGHMGICNSDGVIHDFAGPYLINVDCMAFGDPTRYWPIAGKIYKNRDPLTELREYDAAIESTTDHFRRTQMYNFFCNNCHSFVACCMEAAGLGHWNMMKLCFFTTFCARYVSLWGFIKSHLPFLVIVTVVVCLSRLS